MNGWFIWMLYIMVSAIANKAELKQRLLDLIARKQAEDLSGRSMEDL